MRNLKKIFLLVPALVAVLAVASHADDPQRRTLPNGLTVLAMENKAAPVVSVRVYVRTGSIYERQFLGSGLSHLFEHTLFEGTKTRDKVALNDEIQAIGGQSNAYTSYDVTCYHITTASQYFRRALNVLADMMQNATFPEAEVKVQQGVIHNEMALGDDDPDRELSEVFNTTAFQIHPVRFPIIGYKEQFDALTRDDIVSYYKAAYNPGNAIISVAGDVSAAQVFDAATQEFGDWKRTATSIPALPSEPIQIAPRRAVIQKNVNLTYLQMGWHTVPLQHPDLYALDTLSQILGGGDSSRLIQVVQESKNLVTGISSFSSTPNYDAGIFGIRATLLPKNIKDAQLAITNVIKKIKAEGVTAEELTRAKRQIRAAFLFNSQGVENQAEQMAYDEMGTGDPDYSARYVSSIEAVTAEQVKAAANKYLTTTGLTTAIVEPKSSAANVKAAKAPDVQPAKLIKLANGVRLIVRQNKMAPTVSITAMGMGGVRLERPEQAGISAITTNMLTRGTKTRSAEELAKVVDDLGGALQPFSGYNAWGLESQWLASDWRKGISLVAESMLTPTFPDAELKKVKTQTLAALAAQNDDPMTAASLLLRKTFYGKHPYGRPAAGIAATVSKLTTADLVGFWNSNLQPNRTVISVYGDIDPVAVEKTAQFLFGTFTAKGTLAPAPPAVVPPSQFTKVTQSQPGITQTALWYGFASTTVRDKDRYALDVLDAAMSGADLPGGRLHARLRDNQLVYVVHAYNSPGLDQGMFVVYAATQKSNLEAVETIIKEELEKVRTADISEEELARAKSMCIAAHAIDGQTNGAQAREAASDELFGLGYRNGADYSAKINAITLADVRAAAQKYFNESKAALAIVQPK